MNGPPPTPAQAATNALDFRISEYTAVAGAVVYYYDMMLTWSTEFELLWERGSRFIKIIYLINRYLPLYGIPTLLLTMNPIRTGGLSLPVCTGITVSNVACQAIGTMCTTTLFTLRIRSLYMGKKNTQRFLLGMLIVGLIVMVTITFVMLHTLITSMQPIPGGCIPGSNKGVAGNYVSPIVIEIVVLTFTIRHSITFRRSTQIIDNSQTKYVLRRLYLDGGLYFVVAVSLRLWSALTFAVAPPQLGAMSLGPDYALTCTLTSRFFLSLRQSIQQANMSTQYDSSQNGNNGTYPGPGPGPGRSGQAFNNSRTANAITSGGAVLNGKGNGQNAVIGSKNNSSLSGYNRRSGTFAKRGSLHGGNGNGGIGRRPGSGLEGQVQGHIPNLTVISDMHMESDWERDETPYHEDLEGSDKLDTLDTLDTLDGSIGKPRGFDDDIELNALRK